MSNESAPERRDPVRPNTATMPGGRRKFAAPAILAAVGIVAILSTAGCAGIPSGSADGRIARETTPLADGVELVEGRGWTAVRAELRGDLGLALAFGLDGEARTVGAHLSEDFADPDVLASIAGSPHRPIRLRSALPQDVSGYFSVDGKMLAGPDGTRDALGIDGNGRPVLLSPGSQDGWTGDALVGFYAILIEGKPLSPVDIRDAVGAVGWNAGGNRVVFFVSRGRKGRGYSYREAGEIMRSLGAVDAIALDGGGSARLVWRNGNETESFPAKPAYRAVPNRVLLRRRPILR